MTTERVNLAIFAKAPIPGLAKTRLIPALGAAQAARLQRQLTLRTLATAFAAQVGPVSLWCAPDTGHRFFRALARCRGLRCEPQQGADLGARMAACFAQLTRHGPTILIGTDCPALSVADLRHAAQALHEGIPVVVTPAEDGGYVLIGLRAALPALFSDIAWGSERVMAQTRQRLLALGTRWREPPARWDLDRPEDLERLRGLVDCKQMPSSRD